MAAVLHNHVNYQARLDFIQKLLAERLGLSSKDLEQTNVTPIQYDPNCPFNYNNYVYKLTLSTTLPSDVARTERQRCKPPGCVPIPAGTNELILRLSNPNAEGMNSATRIENEVAIINLASAALRHFDPPIVPRVFDWGSAASSQGWILQELMPGAPLYETFEILSLDRKKDILGQMANILKALQDYRLPDSIVGWGGATFDPSGHIMSAAMTSVGAGPWSSFEDFYAALLRVALKKADLNPHIQGWRFNGVRERLDAFVDHGLPPQFASLPSSQERTIVHADFTTSNLLYDRWSGRITALLDYDFASITHPSYEFFRSFGGAGGQFGGWLGDDTSEETELRNAKLNGFPSPLPITLSGRVQWEVAKAWEDQLERLDVKRPSTTQGIDKVAKVDAVLRAVLPWRLSSSDFFRMQSQETIWQWRQVDEERLAQLLGHLGF